jgi:Tol biopolymer transport system component
VTDLAGRFAYGTDVDHIWVVDAVTGQRTQVTHGRGSIDVDPHRSPDGERLVFRSERFHAPDPTSTSYDGIFVINGDGTGEHSREDIGKPAVEPRCTSDTTGYLESRTSYYRPLSEPNFRSVAGVGFEPT